MHYEGHFDRFVVVISEGDDVVISEGDEMTTNQVFVQQRLSTC